MSGRIGRVVIPLISAAAILAVAGWLGQSVHDIQVESSQSFDVHTLAWALPFGYLASALGALAIAGLAWWSRNLAVGIVYVLVGAFLACLFPLNWVLAASVNGAPPILPEPVARFIGQVDVWAEPGPVQVVVFLGAGMFVAGCMGIALALRDRTSAQRWGR